MKDLHTWTPVLSGPGKDFTAPYSKNVPKSFGRVKSSAFLLDCKSTRYTYILRSLLNHPVYTEIMYGAEIHQFLQQCRTIQVGSVHF